MLGLSIKGKSKRYIEPLLRRLCSLKRTNVAGEILDLEKLQGIRRIFHACLNVENTLITKARNDLRHCSSSNIRSVYSYLGQS